MKLIYKKEVDVLLIEIAEGKVSESDESKPGIIIDFDANGRILRIEILDASERTDAPFKVEFEEVA
jgi:uncharacterized protein YuzE